MGSKARGGRRDAPVVWGFVALFCLGTVLFAVLHTTSAGSRTVFGPAGSTGVLLVALAATVVGVVVALVPAVPRAGRVVVGVVMAVIWAAVCAMAGASLFVPHAPNTLTGLLLAGGAIGMGGVLVHLVRRRVRPVAGTEHS
ncbi:hypothetical protein ACNTMW_03405 [Planosporangium sp. 12N6]|uniref:hypothetical protein n=1 Tax=Planosporangium spinosum TaxID=3402278 RepID=UPI003CEE2388